VKKEKEKDTIQDMFYLLGGILLWYVLIFVYKTKTGSPSVMSKDRHVKRLVKYVKPGMKVADLGCGNAEVMCEMVGAGAKLAEGWEIEPLVYLMARIKIWEQGMQESVKVHFGDMWRAELAKYDLVYVYQLTRYAPRFVAKCRREMKKGAIVIANTYPLRGLPLVKRDGELLIYQL